MDDNDLVTHGLHWLTLSEEGWECACLDCDWSLDDGGVPQEIAQHAFDWYHSELSEAEASVQP